MADQADFPDIYIDASAGAGGVGSQADPYNNLADVRWVTGGDNSIFDYYAGSPAASVTINLKRGEVWRSEVLNTGSSGTATHPIIIQGYGAGDNPLVDGSIDITTAAYKWTASGSGTNEFYLEAAAGGDSGISEPKQVFIDDVRCGYGAAGTLTDHQFDWADNDALGYSTVYVRDEDGDPDTSGVVIDASRGSVNYCFYIDESYITIDGIDCKYSNGHGFRLTGGGDHIIIKNCAATYNFWAGVQLYTGAHDCEINNVEVSHSLSANISADGTSGNPINRLLITGCDIHDTVFVSGLVVDAAGIKAFNLQDSTITKSKWYNCNNGGIRLDGGSVPSRWGCDNNEISENELYGNASSVGDDSQIELEFSSGNTIKYNYLHTPDSGKSGITLSHTGSEDNLILYNISEGNTSGNSYRTRAAAGDTTPNVFIGNTAYNTNIGFYIYSGPLTVIKNNIVLDSTHTALWVETGLPATIKSDYNCFHIAGGSIFKDDAVQSYDLAGWRTFCGNDVHSIDDDPLLTDPGADDYTLTSDSPCIDAGFDLGDSYKWALDVSSTWPDGVVTVDQDLKGDGWEIGAYASPAGAGTSNTTLILLGR